MAPTVPIEFVGQKESKKYLLSQPMGKSRKYSKGHSSGFVPEYRHAVETMGESEGFGSSVRVDNEMTASDDSCAPKRKCISLNAGGSYDNYGVPMEVLSLSRMSRSQRKSLEFRLKRELEQVRTLQRKVVAFSSNVVALSPSSDIWSCSDGQKRPSLEGLYRSSDVSAPQSKKRPPSRNGPRTKKGGTGRSDPAVQAAPGSTTTALLMKQCESLLKQLMDHQFGWVFNTPVDVVKLNIPDYFNVIKHPMDLGTTKSKIASGLYSSPLEFAEDVRLTFSNAMTYNPPQNDVHIMAKTLSKYFEVRWKNIVKKLPVSTDVDLIQTTTVVPAEKEKPSSMLPSKRKKITPSENMIKPEPWRRVMTDENKEKLSADLEALLGELPETIIDFLKEQSYNANQTAEDEIEIDIYALSDETLFKLRKLLDDYLLEKQKNEEKAEPCEMELPNESGFSNSSMPPCKGNDPVDEDIDIVGGNDPRISSYPSVEIEEDAANKNSKCSSSNGSSSELGSSSGDSDSGNSSESEADAAKASALANDTKERAGEGLDQNRSAPSDSEMGNAEANGLAQGGQNPQSEPSSSEADGLKEGGESALRERQVSPEKLYRAALLKNRFADIILKAREKALEKDEKRDPEKLRMEREELERRRKEEKARLQAEAKAAEEARRKAEVEAAAEAKKKRELEREAARQALLEMEKTVNINENSQFMEDLEMLRTAQDEHLPSFMEETSPDHSRSGLGSFKLQGNPLEQLGLYMKEDDEEEEEVEPPQSIPGPAKDVEEGEID